MKSKSFNLVSWSLAAVTVTLVAVSRFGLHCEGAKILSLSYFASKSHKNVYEHLLVSLASRGHEITIVNPIKPSSARDPSLPKPIRDIVGVPYDQIMSNLTMNVFEYDWSGQGSLLAKMFNYFHFSSVVQAKCPGFYGLPQIKELLQEEFDLILINPVLNECLLGIVHVLKAPVILVTTLQAPHWITSEAVGAPVISPITSLFFSETFDERLNFLERVETFLCHVGLSAYHDYWLYPQTEALYRAALGPSVPSVHMILKNASLILSNSHFSLNSPRVTMPNDIEVGGMHCRDGKPLPDDLEAFLGDSQANQHGFIYFSFGSIVKMHQMPPNLRTIFVNVFGSLNQKVIWKWEEGIAGFDNLPPNVKLQSWIPQQDVLGHRNCRLFITHGGLLSTEEAVYHGIPLVGFPMYGDQQANLKWAEKMGFGTKLNLFDGTLTEDKLREAVTRILNQPKFKEKAKEMSSIFRGRPQSPVELGIYWVEYVLRHSGAPHLKSVARELDFFAYHSIDVVLFLICSLSMAIYWIYVAYRISKACASSVYNNFLAPPNSKLKVN